MSSEGRAIVHVSKLELPTLLHGAQLPDDSWLRATDDCEVEAVTQQSGRNAIAVGRLCTIGVTEFAERGFPPAALP
jgi:hypothetical protein